MKNIQIAVFVTVALFTGSTNYAQQAPPAAYSNATTVNYIRSWDATAPEQNSSNLITRGLTDVKQSTQYIDGLGRPIQTVLKQGSLVTNGATTDMVNATVYDVYGREQYKYLPFASNAAQSGDIINDGNFKLDPFQQQTAFYSSANSPIKGQGENFYYSQINYEASPLNRVAESFSPGNSWVGTAWNGSTPNTNTATHKSIQQQYLVNTATENVQIWSVVDKSLNIAVSNLGNGNESVTYSWASMPGVSTVLYQYRPQNSSGGWSIANVNGGTNPTTCTIPVGNYDFSIQVYFNNGSPTATIVYGTPAVSFISSGAYANGQLYKNVTIDENGKQVIEYKNKEGQVVLKKVQLSDAPSIDHTGWLCTYYVYDDFGLLRFVMQPRAVELISSNWSVTQAIADELCFRYEYDDRKRMIIKKVPGAGEVWMVYDYLDRLVMTQDANLRTAGKWLVTSYDILNRPVATGLLTDANSRIIHATNAYYSTSYPSTTGGNYELYTQTFYDNYTGIIAASGYTFNNTLDASGSSNFLTASSSYPYPQVLTQSSQTLGLVTGTKVKVIGTSNQFLYTINFFDDHNRIIQTQNINVTGGKDITTTQYDWSGKPLRNLVQHNKNGNNTQNHTVLTKMNYDALGRLLTVTKTVSSSIAASTPEITILSNTYNELGQLTNKSIGQQRDANNNPISTPIENLSYDYNIRRWLLGVNRSFAKDANNTNYFGFDLGYDKADNGLINGQLYNNPQYNGNIGGIVWKSKGDGVKRKFDYSYDAVNRLMKADFTQYSGGTFNQNDAVNFNVKMGDGINVNTAYDANGNILQMQQWGLKVNSSIQIDNLAYTLQTNSNKLAKVTDAITTDNKLGDFKDGTNGTADDYSYDANGNLILDNNKQISNITYNYLNLPSVITVTGKGTISYTYDAAGNKLQKTTVDNTINQTTTTLYVNGFVYQNDILQFLPQEEGRVRFLPTVGAIAAHFVFDYFIKDHLGNTRLTLTDEQQTDTYPAATLEDGATATESLYYTINTGAIVANPPSLPSTYQNNNGNPPYNTNPNSNTTATSAKMYKLNGYNGDKTGLNITLKVMAGDVVNILGKSFWHSSSTLSNSYPVSGVINNLLNAFGGSTAVSTATHDAVNGTVLNASTPTTGSLTSWVTNNVPTPTSKPKAYINWVLFDEQFKVVTSGSGFDAINDNPDILKTHTATATITTNGYLVVYCSNESNQDVFFDNLQVIQTRGPILSEDHYYPFGLTMAGISSQAAGSLENLRKFNKGSELQHKEFSDGSGLELYATNFRSLDPQLGRWWQIDPKASESESPYASMSNNPIRFNDPLGDTIVDTQIKADKNWSKAYNTFLNSKAGKRFVKLYSPGGKYGTTTVEFKIGGTGASGKTDVFSINRKDGSAIKLETDKKYDGIDKIAKGESKGSYLKFEVNLRAGEDMSNSVEQVEGGETILHETQHVRIDQQTLITDKAMNNAFYQHQDWMKPTTSDWYQERAGFYIENKQMWQADYERQKAQGKVKNESEYIQKKVNDFFN